MLQANTSNSKIQGRVACGIIYWHLHVLNFDNKIKPENWDVPRWALSQRAPPSRTPYNTIMYTDIIYKNECGELLRDRVVN